MAGKIPNRPNKAHNAKPYDRPKNIFQKVTSTLYDFLMPSWLLYDSSKNNDQNIEQEGTSQEVVRSDLNQPLPESSYIPERRPCCSSYATDLKDRREKQKNYEHSSGQNTEETVPLSKPDMLSSTYVFQRKSSVKQHIVNGDDHSENSEGSASTSGCSSLVSSHQERREQIHDTGLQISEEGLEQISKKLTEKQLFKRQAEKRDISVETDSVCHETEGNMSTSRTPLWFEDRCLNPAKRARPQPSATGRRPSFSLSGFGAPNLSDSRSPANKTFSPFYEGKTVFGGASSNRRANLLPTMSYQQTRPHIARLNVKEASSKKEFDYMSTTAKRILQSLEKMSTPLEDAKKIPAEGKSDDLAFAARHGMMPSIMALKRKSLRPYERGPPIKTVLIPSPTVIGKNLEPRITPPAEKKKNDDATAIQSSPFTTFMAQCSSSSAGGKLKARPHSSIHHSRKQDSDEVMDVPDLPNVPLPVTQLPTFSFNNLSKNSTKSNTTVASSGSPSGQPIFTFSSPVEHIVPSSSQIACPSGSSFTFSSPVIKDKIDSTKSTAPSALEKNDKSNTKEEKGHFPASSSDLFVGGSVMDVLEKSEPKESISTPIKEPSSNNKVVEEKNTEKQEIKADLKQDKVLSGFGDKFKPEPGSWECTSCLVRNKEGDNECVACTAPKPSKVKSSNATLSDSAGFKVFPSPPQSNSSKWEDTATSTETKSSTTSSETSKAKTGTLWQGFGDKFKPPADTWNCPTCMINNNSSLQQCEACGTANPRTAHPPPQVISSPSSSSPITTSSSSFGDRFKPPPGTWICDTCFVPNGADLTKCKACETPRIVVSQTKDPKQAFSGFKFSIPDSKNADGGNVTIKFGVLPTSTAKTSETTTTTEAFGFKFGTIPTESKPSSENVNFGISTSSHTMSSGTFVFGDKPLEKPVSTSSKPGIAFSMPTNSSTSGGFTFGQKPLSTAVNTNFKFGVQHSNQEVTNTKEESTSVTNSVSLGSIVSSSAAAPFSSTNTGASLSTATTTVPVFSFGKSAPIMSTSSKEVSPPSSTEENTVPKTTSTTFHFVPPTSRPESLLGEGPAKPLSTVQKTSEETKLTLFGAAKPVIGLKQDTGLCVKSEAEQKISVAQTTASTFTSNSTMPFTFGSGTKNNSGFIFGTPKTEPTQGNIGGFSFAVAAGKQASGKPASGFGNFSAGTPSQVATTTCTFTFGSGGLVPNVTTTTAVTTTCSVFSFGTYSSPAMSSKPETVPQTTSVSLFSASPQGSFPSFGSTSTFGQQSQIKQEGCVFQASSQSPALRFGNTAPAPVFRFGAPQEQKPAGFTFGASRQESEQKNIETTPQKPAFCFGFSSPQTEQKPPTIPQDSNFLFSGNSSQSSEQEKPKTGFNFSFNPMQQTPVFGTGLSTTTTSTVPTFNFTGNTAPTATPFSFSATPNTPSSSRKIKRAVRRTGLSGRRD